MKPIDFGPLGQVPPSEMFVSKPPALTLRDYLAGQALAGILAGPAAGDPFEWPASAIRKAGDVAYVFADAMLESRKQTND